MKPELRALPPVHRVLDHPSLAEFLSRKGHAPVAQAVREVIEAVRIRLGEGESAATDVETLARRVADRLSRERPHLRPVLNATGILLNTGLGRSPLAEEAVEAVARVARGYCNLEYDLDRGERGRRTDGVEELLRELTGGEAAAVVNNNAAATLIALRALAAGGEVIISRGQLIEIGGSFRLPEILEASGARLREVGTTNKTRLADYERAIGPDSAAILRVHPSNYRIVGFTEDVPIADLAKLAHANGILAIDDIGSGAIGPNRPPGVSGEPTAQAGLAAGADVVLFSGDKLLGGPQCGILVGRRQFITRIQSDPMMRAMRVDKMTLAALEATLRLMRDPALAAARIPLWSSLNQPVEALRGRAERLATALRESIGLDADVTESTAFLGGGSAPCEPVRSVVVRVRPPVPGPWSSIDDFARGLRLGDPAVVARVNGGCLLFDLRAMPDSEDVLLERAIGKLTTSN